MSALAPDLRKVGYLLLVCALLGVGAAAFYTLSTSLQYSSSARVLIAVEAVDTEDGVLYQAIAPSTDLAEIATSSRVLDRVSQRLGDDVDRGELSEAVAAEVVPDTTVVRISVTDPDPEMARDIVRAHIDTLSDGLDDQEPFGPDAQVNARVLDGPEIDDSPVGRAWARNLATGAALGLLIGLGVAAGRARRSVSS